VREYFYKLYEQWSAGHVPYTPNLSDELDVGWGPVDVGWGPLAVKMKTIQHQMYEIQESNKTKSTRARIHLGTVLKDQSLGRVFLQKETPRDNQEGKQEDKGGGKQEDKGEEGQSPHFMTRLGETYSNKVPLSRCQFLVSSGGGIVLFNRVRRACQSYIHKGCEGDVTRSVVNQWKVFGEAAGIGRSDSCVLYLAERFDEGRVTQFIDGYLWPNVKDLVADQFQPMGLHRLRPKPIWAINVPPWPVEHRVLGTLQGESAGALMGSILGRAFEKAQEELAKERPRSSNKGRSDEKSPLLSSGKSEQNERAEVEKLVKRAKKL
jgi:hypothetical protein